MKKILEDIIKSIVLLEDAVKIKEILSQRSCIYEVSVDKSDMGRLIGKNGGMYKAIRHILKVIGAKEGKIVEIYVIE